MNIRPYQVHNILKIYTKKLIRKNREESVSAQGKRRAVIEKITDSIINKITQFDFENKNLHELSEYSRKQKTDKFKEALFVYNVIDKDNKKITCTVSRH